MFLTFLFRSFSPRGRFVLQTEISGNKFFLNEYVSVILAFVVQILSPLLSVFCIWNNLLIQVCKWFGTTHRFVVVKLQILLYSLKPAAHLAILCTDHRDRRIKSLVYIGVKLAGIRQVCSFPRFPMVIARIASKANPSGWAILSHEFSKLLHRRDRRKKSPGVSAPIVGEFSLAIKFAAIGL